MKPPSQIGTEGSQACLTCVPRLPADIIANPPRENFNLAIQQLSQCGWHVKWDYGSRTPTPTEPKNIRTKALFKVEAGADWETPLKIIDGLMMTATNCQIIEWLGRLAALIVQRRSSDEVTEVQLLAYAQNLCTLPGDIVRAVLLNWPQKCKYWPAYAELYAEIKEMLLDRTLLQDGVNRLHKMRNLNPDGA